MMDKELLKLIGAAAGGLLIGGGATYLIVKPRLEKKYAAIADEEIASVKRVYRLDLEDTLSPEDFEKTLKEGMTPDQVRAFDEAKWAQAKRVKSGNEAHAAAEAEIVSETRAGDPIVNVVLPQEELSDLKEMIADYNGTEDGPPFARVSYTAPEPTVHDPFFDDRDSREPYLITVDEYHDQAQFPPFTKAMLVYYAGDGTLADERGYPIDDIEQAIGPKAIDHFGDHSGSEDVVYVRKEDSDIDFEVTRDPRSYEEVVGGGHPSKARLRKMDE